MIKRLALLIAALGVSILAPQSASAFPEMIRFGYVNCTSCHVSPSGGGVLTDYGRELSAEVLSTWARDGETAFAYGALPKTSWLNLGGDLRAVEIYRNTPQVTATRFINMQDDLEAAGSVAKFTFDASAGLYMNSFETRRFYALYHATDELNLRVGKFRQAYGLIEPDHTTPITRGLGWDEDTESYNVEASWLSSYLNIYLTANFGPLASDIIPPEIREKGAAFRAGVPISDHYLVGASYFHGVSPGWNRDVAGPYAMLGFTKRMFLLSEIDFQSLYHAAFPNETGWVTWSKFDYEFLQGLHGYLTYQLTRPRFSDAGAQTSAWSLGSQWFPRPHFEFDLQWMFQSTPSFPDSTLDYAVLLLHYYF